jgi:hypothetical protein
VTDKLEGLSLSIFLDKSNIWDQEQGPYSQHFCLGNFRVDTVCLSVMLD